MQSGPFHIPHYSQRGQVGVKEVDGPAPKSTETSDVLTAALADQLRAMKARGVSGRLVAARAYATKDRRSSLEGAPETRPCVDDRLLEVGNGLDRQGLDRPARHVAPDLYKGPLLWSGKTLVAKHGAHDGTALSKS